MAGSRENLLWVEYEGSTGRYTHQLRSTLRQHVMLNFFAQRALHDRSKIATCERAVPSENTVSADLDLLERLACPKPTPALIRDQDQLVYRAAWWHCYTDPGLSTPFADVPDWQQDCKRTWNAAFWQMAKQDETLLEVFMGFAAAKEAAIKCLPDAPAYYRHKGRALALLAKDVNDESSALREECVIAIALFCHIYFIESDYESAELHCQALARLISGKMHMLPAIPWQFIIAADMRMTGIRVRAPAFPYHLHKDFRTNCFFDPPSEIVEAALNNLRIFPVGPVFSTAQALRTNRLLQGLHGLAHAHARSDSDRTLAWGHIYDVGYVLAQLQVVVERYGSMEEQVILIGCQMQYWGMMRFLTHKPEIQKGQLRRLANIIASLDPVTLCSRWEKLTGSLDLLLWTLCNACVCVLHSGETGRYAGERLPDWLKSAIEYIFQQLTLRRPEGLRTRLEQMPFTQRWNEKACQYFEAWSKTGDITQKSASNQSPSSPSVKSIFQRLRMDLDIWHDT